MEENETQERFALPGAKPGRVAAWLASAKDFVGRSADRIKDPNMGKHFNENFFTPNQDIIKDYMVNSGSTFEEAMKWAAKEDAMNDPKLLYKNTLFIDPKVIYGKMLNNAFDKEINKQELAKDGIKRVN